MPAVRTRLLGWSSGGNDPNVDAPLPQRSFPNFFSFQTHLDDDSLSTETHDSSRHTTTPIRTATPSTPPTIPIPINSSPSTPSSGSTDPTHVRRPRNSFIIFRCKYSREHTKSQLPDTPVVNDTIAAKSLSKRASEAWSKLTQEEKKVFEDMASLEKEEHARKNPDYRFKPKKRQQDSKRRKPRRIPSLVGLRRRMASSSPQQSQGHSVSSSSASSSSSLLPTIHARQPLPTPLQFDTAPKVVDPAVKAARRRSASAPQPYKPVALPALPQIERPDIHQRSRSIVARPIAVPHSRADYTRFGYPPLCAIPRPIPPPSLSSPDLSFGYDGTPFFRSDCQPQSRMLSYTGSMQGHFNPDGSTQIPSYSIGAFEDLSRTRYISPLAAVATTLSGWSSDFTATPSTTPLVPSSPIESPLLWQENCIVSQSPDISQAQSPSYPILDNKSYTNVDNANVLYNDSPLGLSTPPYSESDTSPPPFMLSNFLPGSEPYREASERSQALQEYELGLSERVGSGSPIFGSAHNSQELEGLDFGTEPFDFDLNTLFPPSDIF
ncbi:hypothetical protein BDN71DRAFT_1439316 [Pleurotus eryngii]|uniref:HMG box domain-containing protein n=1 Tax=Pleurotus eryngii TaxID=5323 RepID=A0A9P6DJK8_PLEER|nr:hypothetical protein BDN71DRAFT_1439316 [Pleurotus eryngii]